MARRFDPTTALADQVRAVRDAYLMATPDKEDTAWAVLTRAADSHEALLEAVKRAREELRLIRAKDTGAVYDTTLRLDVDLAIATAEGRR